MRENRPGACRIHREIIIFAGGNTVSCIILSKPAKEFLHDREQDTVPSGAVVCYVKPIMGFAGPPTGDMAPAAPFSVPPMPPQKVRLPAKDCLLFFGLRSVFYFIRQPFFNASFPATWTFWVTTRATAKARPGPLSRHPSPRSGARAGFRLVTGSGPRRV